MDFHFYRIHMEKMLKNDDLIRNLCLIHDKNMQLSASQHPLINGSKSTATHMTHHRDHSLGKFFILSFSVIYLFLHICTT